MPTPPLREFVTEACVAVVRGLVLFGRYTMMGFGVSSGVWLALRWVF